MFATIALAYAAYAGLAIVYPVPMAAGLTAVGFAVLTLVLAIATPRLLGLGASSAKGKGGADPAMMQALLEAGASAADVFGDVMLARRADQARRRKQGKRKRR